ncbi:HPr kinase/phosphorylase [Pseudochelatococcus sp. G4_1912]|uniref:HPr kinase/phosphorylase n=1 Tax=Pseudochelatococcus sp. G4_1912 TaxID=3114288 RepID=UPI0039C67413
MTQAVVQETIHATAIVVGEMGVLIRGRSGSGKSTLARQIVQNIQKEGRFARLISDDRVCLTRVNGRLVASRISAIEGMLEIRGMGIMSVLSIEAAVVGLVVDCGEKPERLPCSCDIMTTLLDIPLQRIAINGFIDAAERVIWFMAQRENPEV